MITMFEDLVTVEAKPNRSYNPERLRLILSPEVRESVLRHYKRLLVNVDELLPNELKELGYEGMRTQLERDLREGISRLEMMAVRAHVRYVVELVRKT